MDRELPDGHRVKYRYERPTMTLDQPVQTLPHEPRVVISPTGGRAIALILDREGAVVAEAEATCHPAEPFNRKLGRHIALQRALAELDGTMEIRRQRQLDDLNRRMH